MSASPHANAELRKKLRLPDFRDYAIKVDQPGNDGSRERAAAGCVSARRDEAEHEHFRVFAPDENTSNKLDAIYQASEEILDR